MTHGRKTPITASAMTVCLLSCAGPDTIPDSLRHKVLLAPFSVPRDSFFHAALEVPPFEPAWTLDQGRVRTSLSTGRAHSKHEEPNGNEEDIFDALFHEWLSLDVAWGALPGFELGGRLAITGWDEHQDRFELFDDAGTPIVEDEFKTIDGVGKTGRHANLSDAVLRAKLLVYDEPEEPQLAIGSSVKIPISRPDDLTNAGTTDVNMRLLTTFPGRSMAVHANLGVGVPLGNQNLFTDEADVDLNSFVQGAIGITFLLDDSLAAGVQLEANTSAFRDVDFLDDPVFTLFGGLRKQWDNWYLEGGPGVGLDWSSSYDYMVYLAVGVLF